VLDVPAEWLTLDLYAELGVHRTASPEQIRGAYRDLAPRFHPDRHPGDALAEDRFKRISAAYAVLVDPISRARYDQLHLAGPRPVPVRPAPAHRVPDRVRTMRTRVSQPPPEPVQVAAPSPRDEASTLTSLALLVTVGAFLLVVAVAIAVFVIGPDCEVPRELAQLGCPPAP
jgi:hypothetical protein